MKKLLIILCGCAVLGTTGCVVAPEHRHHDDVIVVPEHHDHDHDYDHDHDH
jgi:hypothetical protein